MGPNESVEGVAMEAVLITGGGSGIGAATAAWLTARGSDVVVCGRREAALRRVAAATGCSWTVADCPDEGQVGTAVEATVQRFGRLTGVVAAAGTMTSGSVLDTTPEAWTACLASNATSAFLTARAALPHLLATHGRLVLVSSIAALRSSSGSAAYAAAKAAVVSLGQAIAVECGPRGVRANVVCPGWVRTDMADAEMDAFAADRDAGYAEVSALVPQRRPADPTEVAAAIGWLLGLESSYVNGTVLTVDGGTTTVDAGPVPFDFRVAPRD